MNQKKLQQLLGGHYNPFVTEARNNRKSTRGRRRQAIQMKNGSIKFIHHSK